VLDNFFNPGAIAVIGASRDPKKVGHSVLKNLIENNFTGKIYPVNPNIENIFGKKCYPNISSLPEGIDLAIIAINANTVPETIEECGRKGIKAAIVISAGFKEIGEEGRELEKKLFNAAISNGVRILGPNCLGLINTQTNLNASFAAQYPEKGNISVLSQSGALCTAILDWAVRNHIGFSKLISIGNKVDIDEEVIIEALVEDETTRVIVGYLEDITNGPHFMRTAERVTKRKPIVLIKAGTTEAGAKAASSHTGSIAGAFTAYQCAFRRSGILQASSIEALFDYAIALSYQPLIKGTSIAVITNAGGPGIMAADAVESIGLKFAKISYETQKKLREFLPAAANTANPIDILGDASAEVYGKTLKIILAEKGVDGVVVLLTPQAMIDVQESAKQIVEVAKGTEKPITASFIGAEKVADGITILQKNKIPHYPTPERAVGALAILAEYSRWLNRSHRVVRRFAVNTVKVDRVLNLSRKRGLVDIGEQEAKVILSAYGFTIPRQISARTADEAVSAASYIGYPVVMKIISPDIIHKSDIGGVKIGLLSPSQIRDSFELMMMRIREKNPNARLQGVLIQEMIQEGLEIIIGMTRDPQFGPMLMFGFGGIYVEVLKDVSFQLAPISDEEALEMLMGTKTYKLLKGVRGEKPVDMQLVAECIQRISQLSMDFPDITEMDINPLKVSGEKARAVAVDARIRITKK